MISQHSDNEASFATIDDIIKFYSNEHRGDQSLDDSEQQEPLNSPLTE